MQTHKSYHSSLIESLKDPAEAAAYLDAVFEDGDAELISLALKDVAEAQKEVSETANESGTDWAVCYQLLAEKKMPEFPVVVSLLNKLGLKLSVTNRETQAA